jgi:hypothetical protein
MKVCIAEHHAPGFGQVTVGSLWADDSPYITEAGCFADLDEPAPVVAVRPKVRKFAAKPEGDDAA